MKLLRILGPRRAAAPPPPRKAPKKFFKFWKPFKKIWNLWLKFETVFKPRFQKRCKKVWEPLKVWNLWLKSKALPGPQPRALRDHPPSPRGGKRAHRAAMEIPFGGGAKIKSKGKQRKRALIKGPLGVDKKTKNESRSCLKARFH